MTTLIIRNLILFCFCTSIYGVNVRNAAQLKAAIGSAKPGTVIRLAPGNYGHGIWLERVKGTRAKPVVIEALDPKRPPVFSQGKEAIHLVDCSYITLRNLKVTGCSGNGINADDGGRFETPAVGLVFEGLEITKIGPKGNHDALKLSGVDRFVVRRCHFSGWGGSAIDMVGCHQGIIEGCTFQGRDGFSQSTGVQAKGGCDDILIHRNFFRHAGRRAVNLGGSTGLQFFRPKPQGYEARNVRVLGNRFIGSEAPVAYVTSQSCQVRYNTIVHPGKWVMRILQEQPTDRFKPCSKGRFEQNLILFDKRVRTFVNVGEHTRPETFLFKANAWYATDGKRKPRLPVPEKNGIYQVNPEIQNLQGPKLQVQSRDPRLRTVGAAAYRP